MMIDTDAPLDVEQLTDYVVCLRYDRPDAMNAYNEPLLRGVVETLKRLDTDEGVRAIILTGAGEAFCAGVDLTDMPLEPGMDFAEYETGLGLFQEVIRTLRAIETPVIAAVNGYALGAGCDTALACDFRIVSDEGVLGETFIDVGFVPGDGGAFLLPRLIGEARAKELIFTGRKLYGAEIVEWDLAREQVSADELVDSARQFAQKLANRPPVALAKSKQLVNESFSVSLERALTDATRAQRICSQTADHQEAVAAFNEDREPQFEGK
ncbi:enoyl-CoA hydratase [Halobellus sp. Atlit-38R]|uniref:enoyl-CoA hydratase/isomerase family protein n=1 Tax=Halobellus sp. Atlit-38R TaxID=2282131 RepID=UPI000EF1D737|nr:enoyl-CoA hydratase-related protein [Halobellus sp. Atlit-38R]RLM88554.1 enoyl-CoA hydratase [Halobellus sp. Atlit-38R]